MAARKPFPIVDCRRLSVMPPLAFRNLRSSNDNLPLRNSFQTLAGSVSFDRATFARASISVAASQIVSIRRYLEPIASTSRVRSVFLNVAVLVSLIAPAIAQALAREGQ
jgi:hypothetical protein